MEALLVPWHPIPKLSCQLEVGVSAATSFVNIGSTPRGQVDVNISTWPTFAAAGGFEPPRGFSTSTRSAIGRFKPLSHTWGHHSSLVASGMAYTLIIATMTRSVNTFLQLRWM